MSVPSSSSKGIDGEKPGGTSPSPVEGVEEGIAGPSTLDNSRCALPCEAELEDYGNEVDDEEEDSSEEEESEVIIVLVIIVLVLLLLLREEISFYGFFFLLRCSGSVIDSNNLSITFIEHFCCKFTCIYQKASLSLISTELGSILQTG